MLDEWFRTSEVFLLSILEVAFNVDLTQIWDRQIMSFNEAEFIPIASLQYN